VNWPIIETAEKLGLTMDELHPYGRHCAKIDLDACNIRKRAGKGKLILVSAITPTPAGEGKTTVSIGLTQGLQTLGHSVCAALRQPSLGPCFGMKGGATGGGKTQIHPAERINLHLTGDFHAITAAHNLLAAVLDNHLHFGNERRIDPRRVLWRRVIDMNDRSLRELVIGLGGAPNGLPREAGFDITAASEVMAAMCLSKDLADLRERLERIIVALDEKGAPVYARELKSVGAMVALLFDALMPNLVRTTEGAPVLVHGGPFANIAHGCNSVIATRAALNFADYCVTEAGFAFDLGGEKFFDIKCRSAGLDPAAVVLVATVRALKMHGGVALDALGTEHVTAVKSGLANLEKHVENVRAFGKEPLVALNRFAGDADVEIDVVRGFCAEKGIAFAVSDAFARGGEGALELAQAVVTLATKETAPFRPLYSLEASIPEKIETVAKTIYGAKGIVLSTKAEKDVAEVTRLGLANLPICVAKTQNSLSDDPTLRGRPRDFVVHVRGLEIAAGAGFIVVLTGDVLRMPGLPKKPQAEAIDVVDGKIVGLR
jgi:formate--tetrahydrofolate ligase